MTPQQEQQLAELLVAMAKAIVKLQMGDRAPPGPATELLDRDIQDITSEMLGKLQRLVEGLGNART